MLMSGETVIFDLKKDKDENIRRVIVTIFNALREKGYNPINQIVGYILSEDPTYITTHMGARSLIRKIDRDELLQAILKYYLDV
ncbi:MAG: IreB family regulatory phosphoprotein [Oscillospiraceae bacterium]|nr:IreB family regulatory phosphoprotein [Oscillospiraceae bacterium]